MDRITLHRLKTELDNLSSRIAETTNQLAYFDTVGSQSTFSELESILAELEADKAYLLGEIEDIEEMADYQSRYDDFKTGV